MFVLYKKNHINNTYEYADVWISEDGKIGYEHTGVLGTKGETKKTNFELMKNLNPEIWVGLKEKHYRDLGFDEANESDLSVVVIQFPVDKELVEKVANSDENKREELLTKIDNDPKYDHFSIALTTFSFDHGFFPGFDGFDLGFNTNDKPVLNVYLYGLDGQKFANLLNEYLLSDKTFNLTKNDFEIAYALADDEEFDEKFVSLNNTENFSI